MSPHLQRWGRITYCLTGYIKPLSRAVDITRGLTLAASLCHVPLASVLLGNTAYL